MLHLDDRQQIYPDSVFRSETGIVKAVITPGVAWRVLARGTSWRAKAAFSEDSFNAGDTVRLVAREGLTLLITPIV